MRLTLPLRFPQNLRRLKDCSWYRWRNDCPFPFIQTAFVSHHTWGSHAHDLPRWTSEKFSGTSALINFVTPLLMTRRTYTSDAKGNSILKVNIVSVKPEGGQKPKPEQTPEEKEKEQEEHRKTQEKTVRGVKYGLISVASIILGGGLYIFFVWGAPLRDNSGNEVRDEFSDYPFIIQYAKRCLSEIQNYKTFLAEPSREKLLPDPIKPPYIQPPYTLLIELTGVLVHPDWTYKTGWRFKKRPGINYFLDKITQDYSFEIVIYTQELGFTAFPIIEALDTRKAVSYTLFRDSTKYENGHHIKDLGRLNRDLNRVIMIDCNAASVDGHRANAIVLPKWQGNDDDRTLFDLAALLQTISSNEVNDVRVVLEHYANFADPISHFREKQRILAEQELEKEAMLKQLGTNKSQFPGVSAGWLPSFLRRPA